MDKAKRISFQNSLQIHAIGLWESYCEVFPKLVKFDCPKIVLNARFTRTAGTCNQHDRIVNIGMKFFIKQENYRPMIDVILPHELAHQIDFDLFGESEKRCGHGKNWCMVMEKIGLPANKYHSLEI